MNKTYKLRQNRRMKICKKCEIIYGGLKKQKFCSKHCNLQYNNRLRSGNKHPNYKNGRYKTSDGYIKVLSPHHHRADKQNYVMEHIIVAELKYGRLISENEVVHHRNRIKDDNRPDNLYVFPSKRLHQSFHSSLKKNPELTPEEFMENN